ncbi:hypothetical protein RCL_jg3176.t1 [Rhizophagus clarus]|uniref:Uncharacterized protein n=1 Tax=Rhizophagus clarus TaxID=94130 RepID=A0A8H3R1B5_9GLOM|nr:hypothetical protein RCL_jg3176.t1 [Rhizophagus clarus]
MIGNIARKQTCIGILVQEKFALQLLYQRNTHYLQRNRENEQIFTLQNNPPNQINMALPIGFVMPEFYSSKQDHEDFVNQFMAYINLTGINDNARIVNILDQAIKKKARKWYHREFDNKNWELQNILNNSDLDENWTIVRGQLTNAAPVAVIVKGGIPIILTGIWAGQKLHQIKRHYPTASRYIKMLEIRSLRQEVREDIRNEIYRIGQHKPINDILDNLAKLELRQGVLGSPPSYLNYTPTPPINSNITSQ